jgi:hypothetical protein
VLISRSQEQLSKMIDLVVNADTLKPSGGANSRTARLGAEGQRVLENVKGVLSASKAWGEDKNGDDILQNLFVSDVIISTASLEQIGMFGLTNSTTPLPLMSMSTSRPSTLLPRPP